MEKWKIREVILVEGKYDKIKLETLVEGLILPTNGFGIFRDSERVAMICRLAAERGVLVLTDSDGAGKLIRGYLSGILPAEQVKHAYIPDCFGKEKRKEKPSKEGKLGVEGMNTQVLRQALERAGVEINGIPAKEPGRRITKTDLFEDGLSGGADSATLRKKLQKQLDLPENLSANGLLAVLNAFLDYEEYAQIVRELKETGKEERK